MPRISKCWVLRVGGRLIRAPRAQLPPPRVASFPSRACGTGSCRSRGKLIEPGFNVRLEGLERVGFPDFQDEFAPPLGGGSAELVCGDVDVLLEYYIRSSSMMN